GEGQQHGQAEPPGGGFHGAPLGFSPGADAPGSPRCAEVGARRFYASPRAGSTENLIAVAPSTPAPSDARAGCGGRTTPPPPSPACDTPPSPAASRAARAGSSAAPAGTGGAANGNPSPRGR